MSKPIPEAAKSDNEFYNDPANDKSSRIGDLLGDISPRTARVTDTGEDIDDVEPDEEVEEVESDAEVEDDEGDGGEEEVENGEGDEETEETAPTANDDKWEARFKALETQLAQERERSNQLATSLAQAKREPAPEEPLELGEVEMTQELFDEVTSDPEAFAALLKREREEGAKAIRKMIPKLVESELEERDRLSNDLTQRTKVWEDSNRGKLVVEGVDLTKVFLEKVDAVDRAQVFDFRPGIYEKQLDAILKDTIAQFDSFKGAMTDGSKPKSKAKGEKPKAKGGMAPTTGGGTRRVSGGSEKQLSEEEKAAKRIEDLLGSVR